MEKEEKDIYKKQLSLILESCNSKLAILEQFQEAIEFFVNTILKLKDNLEKTKKIDEISDLIPNISSLAEWAVKYLTDNNPLTQVIQSIHTLTFIDYQNIKNNYVKGIDDIKNKSEFIQQKYEEDTANYLKVYNEYLESCHTLEDLASSPDINAIPPAKEKCFHLQCIASKACEQLGLQRRECALQTEKIMVDFENLEKENHHLFQTFLQNFCKILTDFGKNYQEIAQKSLEELGKIETVQIDRNIETSEPRDFTDFPPLSFNIFDFVSPKTVFADDLHATFMNIISPIQNQLLEFTSFVEGERVVLIQKKSDVYLVESEKNGIRMNVPKSNLKPCKDYKRKIYQLESPMPELGLQQGSYVVGILDLPESNKMKCKTASGDFVEIPKEYLSLYNEKK